MGDVEGVVLALAPVREAGDSAPLAKGIEPVAPARENLVAIGLMAHVPDQLVAGGIVEVVKGHNEFRGAERGAQMTPGIGGDLDNFVPHLTDNLREFLFTDFLEIFGTIYTVEQFTHNGYLPEQLPS